MRADFFTGLSLTAGTTWRSFAPMASNIFDYSASADFARGLLFLRAYRFARTAWVATVYKNQPISAIQAPPPLRSTISDQRP